jgi:SAM-dependent methyltransferase
VGTSNEGSQSPTFGHYAETYHSEHYGYILNDDLNYRLLSLFWRYVLFERQGLDPTRKVLDFGCGLGQISAALPDCFCYDFSPFAISALKKYKRKLFERREEIPNRTFDYLLSSHSLEHSTSPYQDLQEFRRHLRENGRLILVLPIETSLEPNLKPDWNQHLHAWTFQTLTNLLLLTGWTPLSQSIVYGPSFLRTLGRRIPTSMAVRAAHRIGRLRRWSPSMLTIAKLS